MCEQELNQPVECIRCRQLIGCRGCALRWFNSKKQNELSENAGCPLCRNPWIDTPEIVPWKFLSYDDQSL